MSAAGVDQLQPLAQLFDYVLKRCRPESVAILGIAGGNGLDQIDPAVTKRLVGVDFVPDYLRQAQHRFGSLPGLTLICADLKEPLPTISTVDLVHAALVFEHTGLDKALDNALALVSSNGYFSVILQLPSTEQPSVSPSSFPSMNPLKDLFTFIEPRNLQTALALKGLSLIEERTQSLEAGKAFWLGIFETNSPAK